MVVAVADKPQPPRTTEGEPSLIPSYMRHEASGPLRSRQTFEEMRTLGRRGPGIGATLAVAAGLLILLGLLGVGAWNLWRGGGGEMRVAAATATLPPPAVAVEMTKAPTPTAAGGSDATASTGALPLPPGRQPRDLGTPEVAPTAAPSPAASTIVGKASPAVSEAPTASPSAAPTVGPSGTPPAGPVLMRPNGALIRAPRLSGNGVPSIDNLAERLTRANALAYAVDSPVFGASSWSGASDLSGQLEPGWDSANLYLLTRVTDDVFVQEASGILIYQGDSIEVQFDADLAGDFTSRVYNDDDWQIVLSPGNLLAPNAQWEWWVYRGAPGTGKIQIATQRTDTGYVLAAAIPWTLLRVAPKEGAVYGFALNINDNDTPGALQQKSMVSTSPVRQLNDPTSWGTLQLTGTQP